MKNKLLSIFILLGFFIALSVKAQIDDDEQQATNPPFLESDINIDDIITDDKNKDELSQTTSSDEDVTEQIVSIIADSDETDSTQIEFTEFVEELLTNLPEKLSTIATEEEETDAPEQVNTEKVQSDVTEVPELEPTEALKNLTTEEPKIESTDQETLGTQVKEEGSTESPEKINPIEPSSITSADVTQTPIETTELVINTEKVITIIEPVESMVLSESSENGLSTAQVSQPNILAESTEKMEEIVSTDASTEAVAVTVVTKTPLEHTVAPPGKEEGESIVTEKLLEIMTTDVPVKEPVELTEAEIEAPTTVVPNSALTISPEVTKTEIPKISASMGPEIEIIELVNLETTVAPNTTDLVEVIDLDIIELTAAPTDLITTTEQTTTTTTTTPPTTTTTTTTEPTMTITKSYEWASTSFSIPFKLVFNSACKNIECQFGYKTDLFGNVVCSCFNPCENLACGRGYCKIINSTDNTFIALCAKDEIKEDRPNKCLLPPRSGDCGPGQYESRHYWNPSKNRCAHFIYTGCNGNENNFESLERCQAECNICTQPTVRGSCKGHLLRYSYDRKSNSCITFSYSGCLGNQNNFATRNSCEDMCIKYQFSKYSPKNPRQYKRDIFYRRNY